MRRQTNDDQRSKRRRTKNTLNILTWHCAKHERVYLRVPFWEKQSCKELGGAWDPTERRWYVAPQCFEACERWLHADNPHPAPTYRQPLPSLRPSRAVPPGLHIDRFGNVLTDADLSA
jgi:hypothetical protein